jgi:predicted molibdopterin-dependent oxidoreductase YjgC
MMTMREERRIGGAIERGEPFEITVDGKSVIAYPGETVASALFAAGIRVLRHTAKQGKPRSVFCGIGACFDCLVTVNGVPNQRACMTFAQPRLVVTRQTGITEKEVSSE